MDRRYWLLLEKSDETRISKGIDGYQDKTGEIYQYDSLVPNHKQLARGDLVVLRKENDILGVGNVASISHSTDAKIHRRCPECTSTDIRERSTKKPKWKCGRCAHEFEKTQESIVEVQSYVASIERFTRLTAAPAVSEVKRCASKGDGISSQLSILELDEVKIKTLLEGATPSPSARSNAPGKGGQGFGLSQDERIQVELLAMQVARELYELQGWNVVDMSKSQPYDFLATQNGERRFIEVKGTTGSGHSIVLTHGEVKHVKNNSETSALVIVSGIVLTESEGVWTASGGNVTTHQDTWTIDESKLEATQYRYAIDHDPSDER